MSFYRVKVPYGGQWLTSNNQRWRLRQGADVRAWRENVVWACRAAKLPTGITPVRIHFLACYVGRSPVRDRLNLAPTAKVLVDGLVPARTFVRKGKVYDVPGYGLLPDDSDRHVLDTTWELRPSATGQPYVLLEIEHAEATDGR